MPQTNSSDKLLLGVGVAAVVVSFLGLIVSIYTEPGVTGFVVENTTTGTVNLTITGVLLINFTTWNINFGSGSVTAGNLLGNISSLPGDTRVGVDGFTDVDDGLILENIGNLNATLFMVFEKNASDFLGGTGPLYRFNITNVEEGSCVITHPNFTLGEWYEVNDTAQLNISDNGIRICDTFWYNDENDSLRIDIFVGIPSDSFTGALGDVITAGACDVNSGC